MTRVAQFLAERHRKSKAGRTGTAARDVIVIFKDLLETIDCRHGSERAAAIRELEHLENLGLIELERHRRDPSAILQVRLTLEQGEALFAHLGLSGPQEERESLARQFREASTLPVPGHLTPGWKSFCESLAEAALEGGSVQPFDRANPDQTREILTALPAILAWQGESDLRFASSILFGDSKRLKALRPRLESCLQRISNEAAHTLADFGILEHDRSLLLHGPLALGFGAEELDLNLLESPVRLSATDLLRATFHTTATRCLTVENAAMLHELAKRRSGVLLASSGSEGGFANSAVISFLQALPSHVELWHFGDSDPKGFEILADLRRRTGRSIRSLHMQFRPASPPAPPLTAADTTTIARLLAADFLSSEEKQQLEQMRSTGTKGCFEQEAFGHPGAHWPFY
jgi:hypothetical protein